MSEDIPERDWKVFKEIRQPAIARLCEQILAEARVEIEAPGKSSHDRYLSLYKLIENRDDEIARAFNDFRRSTAIRQISIINSMGLFTTEELGRFSSQTLERIERLTALMKEFQEERTAHPMQRRRG